MEIDHHRQEKYSPGQFQLFIEMNGEFIRETSFPEIENVIRDISYARHQCTNFPFLYGGQFDFDRMLHLPYWEFLFIRGDINQAELEDIQDGCLLIIALFYAEIYDDSGSCYIISNKLFDKVENVLNSFIPTTQRQKQIVENLKFLRKYSDDDKVLHRVPPDEQSIEIEKDIENCNRSIYRELVENYFLDIAKGFELSRQKVDSGHDKLPDKKKNT